MTVDGQARHGVRWPASVVAAAASLALTACAAGVGGPSPSIVERATGPAPMESDAGPTDDVIPGPSGAVLDCGGQAISVRGWEGTVSWTYQLVRAGMSPAYSPTQRQAVRLSQSADLNIRADDVEIFPGPDGAPLAANWFASGITGSASVDDESICTTCDTTDGSFQADGTGAPVTEGAEGQAGRDPNYSNFVLSVLLDECTYSFTAMAYVAGLNTQHPADRNVYVGQVALASGPSPGIRSITAPDLTLQGGGSFAAAYDGYPPDDPNGDVLGSGGLSGEVGSHGLGTSGDSTGTVSWSLTPILVPAP